MENKALKFPNTRKPEGQPGSWGAGVRREAAKGMWAGSRVMSQDGIQADRDDTQNPSLQLTAEREQAVSSETSLCIWPPSFGLLHAAWQHHS